MTCGAAIWLSPNLASRLFFSGLTKISSRCFLYLHQLLCSVRRRDRVSLSVSVTVLAVVLTGLRLSKSLCFGDGMYLRQRVLLLAKLRTFVLRWEPICVAEVDACCADVDRKAAVVLSRYMGRRAAQRVEAWLAAEQVEEGSPSQSRIAPQASFSGIMPSFSLSNDMALEDMLELAYMADSVLHLTEDRQWLERFVTILQYVLLRRLSLMEEALLYRRLCERSLFPGYLSRQRCRGGVVDGERGMESSTWVAAWRLHHRPTWLTPLSGGTQFLCLPLSYFPIEAVLPYLACETWLSERLLSRMLPQWERLCVRALRGTRFPLCSPVAVHPNGTRLERMSRKIHYWFLRYTAPLLRACVARQRAAAHGFCMTELSTAAGCEGAAANDLPRSSFALLWQCLTSSCTYCLTARSKGSAPGASAAMKTSGTNGSGPPMSREKVRFVRRALLLRAASQAFVTTFQVCCPRLSVRYVTEVLVAGCSVQGRGKWLSSEITTAEGSASSYVDALLSSMAIHIGWSLVTGIAEVLLTHFTSVSGHELSMLLADASTRRLHHELLCVDEAFYSRWIRTTPNEAGGMGAASMAALPGRQSSPAVGRRVQPLLSVDDVLAVGKRGGERILALHDSMVKRTLRYAVLLGRAAVTREWRPLVGVAVMVWVNVPALISSFSVSIGYSTPSDVARLLSRREESLPTRCPVGLRLLLELLVDVEGERAAPAGTWLRGRPHLQYPYLALVACSSVWTFEHLIADTKGRVVSRLAHLRQLKTVYSAVGFHKYAVKPGIKAVTAASAIAAMQEDVRCVLYYSVYQTVRTWEDQFGAGAGEASPLLHPLLDPEETALLQQPRALSYLPAHVDYYELFSLPYRFVLRQLGLEMLFAYRAAAGMQQDSRQMAEEWWTQTLFNSPFNPLTLALHEAAQLTASCATVLLLCSKIVDGRWVVCPVSLPVLLLQVQTMQTYRDILLGGVAVQRLEDGVAPLQQLSENLPHAVVSEPAGAPLWSPFRGESPPTMSLPALQRRRRHWRHVLSARRPALCFDASDRIVGGLRLNCGVSWHHVYFAYPQLFVAPSAQDTGSAKSKNSGGVRPTLADACFVCPAVGTTAVVGPSGAGKSSLNVLLRRLYDPIAVVECDHEQESVCSAPEKGQRVYVDLNHVGAAADAEDVLVDVLRLALIESALPPPSIFQASYSQPLSPCDGHGDTLEMSLAASAPPVYSPRYWLRVQPGYIALDGIPLPLFSPTYVRQWFSWLPQTAHVEQRQSFLANVRGTATHVTVPDVQRALRMCGCDGFMEEKRCSLRDAVGSLSRGESQRVALASVVAALLARCRLELLHGVPFQEIPGSTVAAEAAAGGLVLDEPTSHLDAANEQRLLSALATLQGESEAAESRTDRGLSLFVWIISHRMSSLRSARHMVVVEGGHITASGPPEEVTKTNIFAKTQVELQRLDEVSPSAHISTAD
ncbi:hypothetical protein JKF63_02328 [Porcisia hertigi]|uniref:ABC transporter family-like protein n=1 Tax=Porcisia hertigi TaxID=2761500 RepID=A0A836HZA7_9TRYP|nr:hypothetical protein JKF63_02328 [Porcisia hertigi]